MSSALGDKFKSEMGKAENAEAEEDDAAND